MIKYPPQSGSISSNHKEMLEMKSFHILKRGSMLIVWGGWMLIAGFLFFYKITNYIDSQFVFFSIIFSVMSSFSLFLLADHALIKQDGSCKKKILVLIISFLSSSIVFSGFVIAAIANSH